MTLYLAFRLDYDHTLTLKRKTKDSLSKLPLDPIGKKEVEICGRLHNIFDTATPLVEEGGVGGGGRSVCFRIETPTAQIVRDCSIRHAGFCLLPEVACIVACLFARGLRRRHELRRRADYKGYESFRSATSRVEF